MIAIIQQVDHIKAKVALWTKWYDNNTINKDEFALLLSRYLSKTQIQDLFDKFGVET